MLTSTTPTSLPSFTVADLAALNFFSPPFGAGCHITQLGDYWLSLTPQPTGPAVASLVLDEDELFTVEVPDLPALLAVHARAVALIAEREAEAEREDLELLAVPVQHYQIIPRSYHFEPVPTSCPKSDTDASRA